MNREVTEKERTEAVKAVVQEQIIECLNRFYAMEIGMWGTPADSLIIRTVVQGNLQGKLYDLSALSEVLGLPISTLHRKIGRLVEDGYLRRKPVGKSVFFTPTERTNLNFDASFEDMIATLRRLYRGEFDFENPPYHCSL